MPINKPEFRTTGKCPICGCEDTATMFTDSAVIVWCAAGDVYVSSPSLYVQQETLTGLLVPDGTLESRPSQASVAHKTILKK